MKKIILMTCLMIFLPFLIVSFFIKEDSIKFQFVNNTNVRIKRENGTIDVVPFEDYIVGVLAGEMPANFELEALKAQALAARSYVLKKIEQNNDKDYDVVDTVMNQVYLDDAKMREKWSNNYEKNLNKIKTAVKETSGEYLTYDGKVIEAFFFSTSAGKTENSEEVFQQALPYLRSVDSSWDSEISPVFNEISQMSLNDFYQKLNIPYQGELKIEVLETTSTGRVKKIKINDSEFLSSDVRQLLNLKSTYFEMKQSGNYVTISTKGYGHGVGMSQYGAQAMALKGYSYQEIVKHYYQNVEISKMKV